SLSSSVPGVGGLSSSGRNPGAVDPQNPDLFLCGWSSRLYPPYAVRVPATGRSHGRDPPATTSREVVERGLSSSFSRQTLPVYWGWGTMQVGKLQSGDD